MHPLNICPQLSHAHAPRLFRHDQPPSLQHLRGSLWLKEKPQDPFTAQGPPQDGRISRRVGVHHEEWLWLGACSTYNVCVRASVRACVRVCVRACVFVFVHFIYQNRSICQRVAQLKLGHK